MHVLDNQPWWPACFMLHLARNLGLMKRQLFTAALQKDKLNTVSY